MVLTVITYPDNRLKEISKPIENFDQELHTILDDMYETMMVQNGIGLAAIQVALPIRALLLNIPDEEGEQLKENLIEMINPTILSAEGETIYQEGCLSVPGFYEDISRYEKVTVSYFDRHGKEQSLEALDLLSVAVQHEMDHLDGKLFIENSLMQNEKNSKKSLKKE